VVAFTVDDAYAKEDTFDGLPLLPWSEVIKHFSPHEFDMHVALSYKQLNQLREAKYHQVRIAGYTLPSYISPKATVFQNVQFGDNCFIQEGNNLQIDVVIGNNVMLWATNHIGHGTVIHDHVYLASHICISGHCDIGERTFMGVNATTRDFCTIGSDCFVTMDASVVRNVEAGSVVLGARCSVLGPDDEKSQKIIQNYFWPTKE